MRWSYASVANWPWPAASWTVPRLTSFISECSSKPFSWSLSEEVAVAMMTEGHTGYQSEKTTSPKKRCSFKTIKNKAVCLQIRMDRIKKKGEQGAGWYSKSQGKDSTSGYRVGDRARRNPSWCVCIFPESSTVFKVCLCVFPLTKLGWISFKGCNAERVSSVWVFCPRFALEWEAERPYLGLDKGLVLH